MNKIKVCHLITRMIIGGAQENTLFTVKGLGQDDDYEVTLATGPTVGPEGKLFVPTDRGFRYILIPMLRRSILPIHDLFAFIHLYKLFRRERYHIVHTHSSKAGVLGRLAARLARIPVIVHTIHGLPFHPYQNKVINRMYILLEKWMALFTNFYISVSDAMTEQAVHAGIASKERFKTIRSAIDLDLYLNLKCDHDQIKKKYGIHSETKIIGMIARLFPLKGHQYIIQIARELINDFSNLQFLFIGDGILQKELIEQIHEQGLDDHFIFVGLVEPNNIPSLVSVMDILVHVSLREGLAKAIVQAFALKKPVVTFDLDGSREIVKSSQTGYLIDPLDLDGLRDKLLVLLRDDDLRKQMGEHARAMIDPDFRINTMVDEIKSLYKELLKCGS